MMAIHRDAIAIAKEPELSRIERARARGCHRDRLEGALYGLERIGFFVRRELLREAEQQLFRAAAGGDQPDTHLHEAHVQLGVRLHARRMKRHLSTATECKPEWRDDHREGHPPQ